MLASHDEWNSLAMVLAKQFTELDGRDLLSMAHCKRALGLLQRVAEASL